MHRQYLLPDVGWVDETPGSSSLVFHLLEQVLEREAVEVSLLFLFVSELEAVFDFRGRIGRIQHFFKFCELLLPSVFVLQGAL